MDNTSLSCLVQCPSEQAPVPNLFGGMGKKSGQGKGDKHGRGSRKPSVKGHSYEDQFNKGGKAGRFPQQLPVAQHLEDHEENAGDSGQHQVGSGQIRLPGQQEYRQKHRSPHLVDGPDE
jgi:hypothetical protein